jgi:hypothetical protein
MPGHFLDFLLTLVALFNGFEPTTATSDTGSGLEPNG